MYTKCAYHNCGNTSQDISMFRFPVNNQKRLSVWIRNSGNPLLDTLTKERLRCRYICSAHFLPSHIRGGTLRSRLIGQALPIHFRSSEVGEVEEKGAKADVEKDVLPSPEFVNLKPQIKCYSRKPRTFKTEENKSTSSSLTIRPIQRFSAKLVFEEDDEDDMEYCKICLVTDCKMFSSPSINKAYSQLVPELCDYEMYVCYECKHLLIKYQEFRSKCMTALKLLSSIQIDHSKVTKRFINDINRKHHKLESKLSHSSMVICNTNEQIALPEPDLNFDIKSENDTHSDALEDDKSEINLEVYTGGIFSQVETRDTEYPNEILQPEHDRTDTNPGALENDNPETNFEIDYDQSEMNVDVYAGGLFSEVETRDTEHINEIFQPEHNRTDTNSGALENYNTETNFEIGGGLISDVETKGKEYPNEIYTPNNIVTETKLKQKCIPNSKKTKESAAIHIITLKSKKKWSLNTPVGYLSNTRSNYMMKLIHNYFTKDKQKCLPSSKKTKESVPKKIKTLKQIKKKRNSDNPFSCLSTKPSDYMSQLIQKYATIEIMTPSEAKKEMLLRKESDNYKINIHKCDLCYKGFVLESAYNNHMKRHSADPGSEECEFCHLLFPKRKELSMHIAGCHKYKIACKCCPFVCFNLKQAKRHIDIHKVETYTCEFCEMNFRYSYTLSNHKRIKHAEHVCAHCGSMFATLLGLKSHKRRAHAQDSQELLGPKCEECNVQFATETAWKRHLVISDKHIVSNGCDECGETFLTAEELKSHEKEHPRKLAKAQYVKLQRLRSKRAVVCKLCDRRLESRTEYQKHVKSAHPNTEAANQIRERERQVEEDKQYICEVCGKVFRKRLLLKYHARSHTGERPHGCEECGKRYTHPSGLHTHNITHHSGAPKFTCDICQKGFHVKGAIRKHIILVHLGVRPFKCDICNKRFPHQCEVRMHMEYVHFKKPWPKRDRTTCQAKRRNKDKDTVE